MWKEGIKNGFEDEDIVNSLSQYQRNGTATLPGPVLWKPNQIEASLDNIDIAVDLKTFCQSPDTTALDEDDPPSLTQTQYSVPKTDTNIFCVSKGNVNLTKKYHPKSCDQKSKNMHSKCLSVCMKKLFKIAPSSESKCPNCYCLLSDLQEKTPIFKSEKISSQKYYAISSHVESKDSLDISNLLDSSRSNKLSQMEALVDPHQSATITSSDDFANNWQNDFMVYKSSLRIPTQLIRIPKIRLLPFRAGSLQYFNYCRQTPADAHNSLCDSTSVVPIFNNQSNHLVLPQINHFKSSVNPSKNLLTNILKKFSFLLKTNNKRKLLAYRKIVKYEKCFIDWTRRQMTFNNITSKNINKNFLIQLKQTLQIEKIRKKSIQKALDILGKQKGQKLDVKYDYKDFESLKQGRQTKSQSANRRRANVIITKKNVTIINKSTGETLLHGAARHGTLEKVIYLLDVGLDPNAQDHAGYTALHESCLYGHLHVAQYLLKYGAEPNCTSFNGIRPLHDAVENEDIELIRLLLSYGAVPVLNLSKSSTHIKEFFQGFIGDVTGQVGDCSQIKPWLFYGTASFLDAAVTGYDLFYNVPEEGKNEDILSFDLSKHAHLPLYKLEKFVRFNSYFLFEDVLNVLGMSRREFILIHTDLEIISISQTEFLAQSLNKNFISSFDDKIELLANNPKSHSILDIQTVNISTITACYV